MCYQVCCKVKYFHVHWNKIRFSNTSGCFSDILWTCHHRAFQAFAIPLLFDGKWPDCVCCLMLPGKIVTCQSSVEWNEFCHVPSSTECISLIFVYRVTFHFIQSPFLSVKIPQQLTLQSEFLMLRTFFFSLRMIIRSSSWHIGHVNFSCRAGNLCSHLVASSNILVAMATKMVATWRVEYDTCFFFRGANFF